MLTFIGFLLPAVIDLFNRKIEDKDLRFWVSVLFCVLVGSAVATLESAVFAGMNLVQIVELIAKQSMAMFGMAQLTYKLGWENSDLRGDLGLDVKRQ